MHTGAPLCLPVLELRELREFRVISWIVLVVSDETKQAGMPALPYGNLYHYTPYFRFQANRY